MSMLYLDVGSTPVRRSRFWHFYSSKWPHRRLANKLLARLPLLILWTLIVTVILYKFTSSSGSSNETIIDNQESPSALLAAKEDLFSNQDAKYTASENQLHQFAVQPSTENNDHPKIDQDTQMLKSPTAVTKFSKNTLISTTKKPEPYLRQGKVFILIIQNDSLDSYRLGRHSSSQSSDRQTGRSTLRLPSHIRLVVDILESHRIDYTIDSTRAGLPESLLNNQVKSETDENDTSEKKSQQYSVIIIDDFKNYAKLNHWMRDQLDRHCRINKIGVITYMNPNNYALHLSESQESINELNYRVINQKACVANATATTDSCLIDYQLNDRSPILRILKRKPEFILQGPLVENIDHSPWVSMSSNHITYEPLTWAKFKPTYSDFNVIQNPNPALSMYDKGLFDGVKRVIFGGANHLWLNRVLLLDAIEHLSQGKVLSPMDRYIQIDIDDVFVAERGKRMNKSDVDALVEAQKRISKKIQGGFKFNLGFSGKFFKHGFESENMGDQQLIKRALEFTWFCHTWSHSKAHLANDSQTIALELRRNLEFARQHKLPMIGYGNLTQLNDVQGAKPPTYAVAPHHSGVYPVHEQLFEAWKSELNVQVTSTEEYPRLRPASGRLGFVYKSIKVLPRQTCGLYTHTVFRDKYPGGIGKLESNIMGGELFETILHNPVNIYMTHMSNYANDRLAPYTFEALLDFVQANTNLQLRYAPSVSFTSDSPESGNSHSDVASYNTRQRWQSSTVDERAGNKLGPDHLAQHYFNLYPAELQPLWTNPCSDKRHLAIWAPWKISRYCRRLVPRLLIVGPQKTGTTALYTYLKLNPLFRSSRISPTDFEEVQFFNDKHYFQGVDWYFEQFHHRDSTQSDNIYNTTTEQSIDSEDELGQSSSDASHEESFYYFDKSATYFDDPKAPLRASHLLPDARVLIMLIDPADRAYSWYQHSRAHKDPIAEKYTFEQIIMASPPAFEALDDDEKKSTLRNRCLQPGFYSQHLTRWLNRFPSRQVFIIDGQWFRHQPAAVMNKLQLMLRVTNPLDYNKLLVYNKHKGFYCSRTSPTEQTKCLGPGKGRKYPPMSERARAYLNRLYWPHNKQLVHLLSEIGQPLPVWLEEATSSSKRYYS